MIPGHEFRWKDDRWVHTATCTCWRDRRVKSLLEALFRPDGRVSPSMNINRKEK